MFQYKSLFIQEAASSLLVALTSVKIADYENRRDHLSLILLGFLLLTLKPLFGMDIIWLPLQIISMLALFWCLANDEKRIKKSQYFRVLATSIPMAIALFLIFPRIVLPWAASQGSSQNAKLGFSTELKPGQIGDLADSNELAFRVTFPEGMIIDKEELYWRGAILRSSNGMEWSRDKREFKRTRSLETALPSQESGFEYEIVIPVSTQQYIFTQDGTYEVLAQGSRVIESQDKIWQLSSSAGSSHRLKARMNWGYRDKNPPEKADLLFKELPPQTKKWVQSTVDQMTDLQKRRHALKELFLQSQLTYTRSPGVFKNNDIDEFLFDRRKGFCEHFAGTYATLARALGIPARVISGYQGGEYNKVGNFWRITQRYAHAWVEVWSGSDWQKVDPTAWAANYEFTRTSEKRWADWISEGIDTYENLNFQWTNFLLDFDQNTTSNAIKELIPHFILGTLGILIGFFLLTSVIRILKNFSYNRRAHQKNELSQLVEDIRVRLESALEEDLGQESPLAVLNKASLKYSTASHFFANVAAVYDQVFYQEYFNEKELKKDLTNFQRRWLEVQILRK